MNYMKMVDQMKIVLMRPLVLQFTCLFFFLLILWKIYQGITFFNEINQEITNRENIIKLNSQNKDNKIVTSNASHVIFGDYVPKNLDAASVRPSTLNFVVVGVLLAGNEKESQVILQKPSGEEFFFNVGDTLPGGGVIKRITSKGVLVFREGALERLSLPSEELHFEPPPKQMVN